MKVCYFGAYEVEKDPRNTVIIKGLKKNGIEVKECNIPIWSEIRSGYKSKPGILKIIKFTPKLLLTYLKLFKKYIRIGGYDVMIVGFPGHFDMPLAKLLTTVSKTPLIFDAFISLYETFVTDREFVAKNSLKATLLNILDKYSCKFADIVLVDTDQHINYFYKEFGIGKKEFRRIFVGADEDIFYPRNTAENSKNFLILFYGTFIPLHGIDYIVKAAKLLETREDIKFQIIGTGQTSQHIEQLSKELEVKNISFVKNWVPYRDLPMWIARADICLGIFGSSQKAKLVIPTKVFQILAMKKPIITGDSPAAREVLTDRENAVLCRMADAEALAESVLLLKQNKKLREKIAENGYELFKGEFSLEAIGIEVRRILEELAS